MIAYDKCTDIHKQSLELNTIIKIKKKNFSFRIIKSF